MQNHFTHALEQAIIKGPNTGFPSNDSHGPCRWWKNQFINACEHQLGLYLAGKGRLQCTQK